MVVIAIAGGTGNVGRTITETLTESNKHRVITLGRKQQPQSSVTSAPSHVVDYANVDELAGLFRLENVHTIISAIQVTDETSSAAEINLVKAADQSCVKRFIASGWGALSNERSPAFGLQKATNDELHRTSLQWTRFVVGFFLDYYGYPHVRTHLPPMSFAVDLASKKAALPGTGNEPITFTYSYDMAKFVAAFLDVAEWNETSFCYGEKTTWNEFIKVAEEVTGSTFEKTYDPIEMLEQGKVTQLPSHEKELASSPFPEPLARQLLGLLGAWVVQGSFDVPLEESLNNRFSAIKPMTVRDMLLYRQELI